jgi:hypothetical protein
VNALSEHRRQPVSAVVLTAHVGYAIEHGPRGGRDVREVYHAIADQDVTVGGGGPLCGIIRRRGEPLCGAAEAISPCPDGLFAPVVNCLTCQRIAQREHITVECAS